MKSTLSTKANAELGTLIINTADLMQLLSLLPKNYLADYPILQKELTSKHPNTRRFNQALKNQRFSKEEYRDRILARLDSLAYDVVISTNIDYLIERIYLLVGDDINRIDELTMSDIGVDILQQVLNALSHGFRKSTLPKGEHPFLAERGRIDHKFWRHADKGFDAFCNGYTTQAALDAWCQLNLHTRCPQSFLRWVKVYGDPRELCDWVNYVKPR
ncbi:hypothetical protein swp_4880 [Shewanella piezotolerans WP3]|uniref:Uncharacterized protein n=1 Tax=Shewanella piezotolerans (strain WP3 / JCM 13877) TaxID=225849 RepID=B8CV25_SHEPW|nr:hypothetical protein [Shewanella piezotolerans]ACJ31501.1 hypothetical protein swp_4880 [Shewanella piezotolerans WP3]